MEPKYYWAIFAHLVGQSGEACNYISPQPETKERAIANLRLIGFEPGEDEITIRFLVCSSDPIHEIDPLLP